ncbi:MAG: NADH-quinone oxidoreductase subunit NuoK [Burkholderiales bacterium]|nr:NADH-quinone oxidoreductase subunit NuoK [Burkholderiales bacterium]
MIGLEPTLTHYLLLSAALLTISIIGMIANRRNMLTILMAIELLLLSSNINFIAFSAFLGDMNGQVMTMFVLATAAAESAIGLALLIVVFRRRGEITVETINILKG